MKKEKNILTCDLAFRHGAFYLPQKNLFVTYENKFKKFHYAFSFLKSIAMIVIKSFLPEKIFYEYSNISHINPKSDRLIYSVNAILLSFLEYTDQVYEISMSTIFSVFKIPRKKKVNQKLYLHQLIYHSFPKRFDLWHFFEKRKSFEKDRKFQISITDLNKTQKSDCLDAFALWLYAKNHFLNYAE